MPPLTSINRRFTRIELPRDRFRWNSRFPLPSNFISHEETLPVVFDYCHAHHLGEHASPLSIARHPFPDVFLFSTALRGPFDPPRQKASRIDLPEWKTAKSPLLTKGNRERRNVFSLSHSLLRPPFQPTLLILGRSSLDFGIFIYVRPANL